jgi:hypothetical protein
MLKQAPIIGYVSHLSPDRVHGFAFAVGTSDPMHVSLYCNGKFIADQKANLTSEMLVKWDMESAHGFNFDMRSLGAFHFRDDIEVKVGNYTLPKTPHLALAHARHGWLSPVNNTLFFFMHIPKTAGTSFRMLLNRQFDQERIWPNKEVLGKNERRYPGVHVLRELDNKIKSEVSLVLGHYPLWTLRFLRCRPQVITFVRKPSDHINSLLYHKKTRNTELADSSLLDILKNDIVDNPQTHYFLPPHVLPGQITESNFEVAVRNMQSCAFVGIQDQFEAGLNFLEKKYDWSFGKRIFKNVGDPPQVSEEVTRLINQKTEWDQKLYALAQSQFKQLLDQANSKK